jgi:hypothetical protein
MTTYVITAPRGMPHTHNSTLRSMAVSFVSMLQLVASMFSEMQQVRREAEKFRRFAAD